MKIQTDEKKLDLNLIIAPNTPKLIYGEPNRIG